MSDLTVLSPSLNAMLAEAAQQEREGNFPWYPAVMCGADDCMEIAVEGHYFCSRECRDAFLREWGQEV